MKRLVPAMLSGFAVLALFAPAVSAGPQAAGAKFAVHVSLTAKVSVLCTTNVPTDPGHPGGQLSCSSFVTQGGLNTVYLVYLFVAQADSDGVLGLSCGLEYNGNTGTGVDVSNWTFCATGLEFKNAGPRGDWPAAGGGNRITWTDCQNVVVGSDGIHTVAGALEVYAYSADRLKITPNRNVQGGAELQIVNCLGAQVVVDSTLNAAWASFGGGGGCNPCLMDCPVPVEPSTWGKIKTLYR